MKFLNILLLSILALTTTNAGVVKRNDNNIDINDLFDNNNTENSSIILNDLSNAFNSFSNNIGKNTFKIIIIIIVIIIIVIIIIIK